MHPQVKIVFVKVTSVKIAFVEMAFALLFSCCDNSTLLLALNTGNQKAFAARPVDATLNDGSLPMTFDLSLQVLPSPHRPVRAC